jgi:hypothetical protein
VEVLFIVNPAVQEKTTEIYARSVDQNPPPSPDDVFFSLPHALSPVFCSFCLLVYVIYSV